MNTEQRAQSSEQRAASTEQRAQSSEQRAQSTEQRALLWRRISSSLALGMTSLLVILAGWMPVSAQEITYNLEPTHELGPELWSIPIGGRLTMSADGTRMLVASIADSAFYVVDVETGEYRNLGVTYDQQFVEYGVDNDISTLVTWSLKVVDGELERRYEVRDIVADTVIHENDIGTSIRAVSRLQNRLMANRQLIELNTHRLIIDYNDGANGFGAWFDDDRGLLYRAMPRMMQEIDPTDGRVLRTWGIRPLRSEVRRPSNSDWLYVFSLETDFANPQNWVEAINLVTGERLTFEKYFWISANEEPHLYGTDFGPIAAGTGRAWIGGRNTEEHLQPIWIFDAEARHTNVLTDFRFYLEGQATQKRQEITPGFDRYLHCWNTNWKDSSITRCNALVPVTTSVEEHRAESTECWLSGEVARIYNVLGVELARLPLNNSGELSASHLEALPMQPLWAVSGDCVRRVR